MGLISEFRTSLENPSTPLSYPAEWLLDIFNGGRTDSGIRVSQMTALQVSTIFACVEIKAGTIGTLDLAISERSVDAKGRGIHRTAFEHDYYDLLEHRPNPEMSSFTMRKTVQAHKMLWGNGYIELQRDRNSRIEAMWPRNPSRIKLKRVLAPTTVPTSDGLEITVPKGGTVYATTEGMETESVDPENPTPVGSSSGGERLILPSDVCHMPGLSLDGRVGQDVIQLARNAVGLALATEKFGGKFFGNGAVGYGILKIPGVMTPERREGLRKSFQESWGGENVNRPMVLETGMDYTQTSMKPDESQFLETRQNQVIELARFFGIPAHMLGVANIEPRATSEQIGLEFVTFGLSPDLTCWEQELRYKMFPRPTVGRNAGKIFLPLFDTTPLTMPDAESQRNYVFSNIQAGVFSQNDGRAFYRLNPINDPAADAHWIQVNMQPLDIAYELGSQAIEQGDGADDDSDEGNDTNGESKKKKKGTGGINNKSKRLELMASALMRGYTRLFRDAFGRICSRSEPDLAAFRRAFLPVFLSIGEQLDRMATADFRSEPSGDELENSRFLGEYLETMRHRAKNEGWASANGHTDEIAQRELRRAVTALAVEVYRSAGTRAGKQKTKLLEEV